MSGKALHGEEPHCRADERRIRTSPGPVEPRLRYLPEGQVASLLEHSAGFWIAQVQLRQQVTSTLRAFVYYTVDTLAELRDGHGWNSQYHADVWRLARLGLPVSRRAALTPPDPPGVAVGTDQTLAAVAGRHRVSGIPDPQGL